jgi:hypothetical protein
LARGAPRAPASRRTSACRIEKQKFESHALDRDKFNAMYMMDPTSDSFGIDPRRPSQLFLRRETIGACSNDHELQQLLFDECEQLQEDRDALREIFKFREPGDPEKESDPNAHVPVNINRLIWCVPRRAASLRRQPVLA